MPASFDEAQLSQAILENVENNAYPESQELVSADLPSSAIPSLLNGIAKARDTVKQEIRALGSDAAPDIDGWITQAKKIQADIERSKATARDIVNEAEEARKLQEKANDAAGKVTLLEKELAFNESIADTVEQIQHITSLLAQAQDAAIKDDVQTILLRLGEADAASKNLGSSENTRIAGILQRKKEQLHSSAIESAKSSWRSLIALNSETKVMTVHKQIQRQSPVHMDVVVDALATLDLLSEQISVLSNSLLRSFVSPRLKPSSGKQFGLQVAGNQLSLSGTDSNTNTAQAIADVITLISYLDGHLPKTVSNALSTQLMPQVNMLLISEWLEPSLPVTVQGLSALQAMLSQVVELKTVLESRSWYGSNQLSSWVETIPSIWLGRRREDALLEVRKQCRHGFQNKHAVERVETQIISSGDALVSAPQDEEMDDDWGAEWGDEEKQNQTENTEAVVERENKNGEDDDGDAWGWDDSEEKKKDEDVADNHASDAAAVNAGDDEDVDGAEEWGWGDDEGEKAAQASPSVAHSPSAGTSQQQNKTSSVANGDRTVTLRETYTVTAIPDALVDVIKNVVHDVAELHKPEYSQSSVQEAAIGLYMIPPLVLAMYRATASNYYVADPAGNMLMYNDCIRLADRLDSYLTGQKDLDKKSSLPPGMRPSDQLILTNDISAVESFGKRAYGREMDSQRTIIRDHLDGAQGFASCTQQPFARECESAVAITVDWIRELNGQWQKVLSHSARLQSLGSLLSTALGKVIMDIEDLSDISEEESKQLVQLCRKISELGVLFAQEGAGEGEGNLVGVYTPSWYKFQWLIEILEGSLADITFLWKDSDLRLEFEGDEVVDLIHALFADSEHRRKAVNQIRRETR